MTAPATVDVLIVEDHPLYARALALTLSEAPGVCVTGQARTFTDALTQARATRPHVIVMDVHLPGGTGITATRELLSDPNYTPHILVLTMSDEDETVVAALRAGARGYLVKDANEGEIVTAVKVVADGGAVFSPTVAARLTSVLSSAAHPDQGAFPTLTRREREVLDLVARGMDNRAIAKQLFLSPNTVRNNITSIFVKLQVSDRGAAVARARDAGLGQQISVS